MPDIRLVTSDAERQAVFAFRYDVIVRELGVNIPTADHDRKVVVDPEDGTGHLFAAFVGSAVVGTTRVNFLRDGLIEPHASLLAFSALESDEGEATSVSSRFLVAPQYRGSTTAIRITQDWYRFCRAQGIERDHILVRRDLAALYVRLGYVVAGTSVRHPEIGEVVPLTLRLSDEPHLRSVNSVFLAGRARHRPESGASS